MREARNSFGHAGLIVEKLIERGRHIEVQIAGDGRGNVVHLFERECSLQRRHQKLIEEAPAANLSAALRDRMLDDAVRLGKRLLYRGVGTVEFILSGDSYYFLEVNPRLQVEHPVTEMVTGIDIVETMLRIAAGEGLPFTQGEVRCHGHAVEARICAEDPADNFLPRSGELAYVHFPGRWHPRRDRGRERLDRDALLRFDAGQADRACRDPRRTRSTGSTSALDDDLDFRHHHQSGISASA